LLGTQSLGITAGGNFLGGHSDVSLVPYGMEKKGIQELGVGGVASTPVLTEGSGGRTESSSYGERRWRRRCSDGRRKGNGGSLLLSFAAADKWGSLERRPYKSMQRPRA